MSQTSCERCGFPSPMRWLHAGGDLAQPNRIYQCTDRTLMSSEHHPKCLPHSPDLTCMQICSSRHPRVPPIIDIGAGIKSP
jgi:hypothetical protein